MGKRSGSALYCCGVIISDVFSLHGVNNGELEYYTPKKKTTFDAETALEQLRLNGVSSDPVLENGEECLDEYYPEFEFFPTKYLSTMNNHYSPRYFHHSTSDYLQQRKNYQLSTRNHLQTTSDYHHSIGNHRHSTRKHRQPTRNYQQYTENHHQSARNYHQQLTHTDTDDVETALERLRQNGMLTIPISESGEVLEDEYYPEYDYFSAKYHSSRNFNHQLTVTIEDDEDHCMKNKTKPLSYRKSAESNNFAQKLTLETNKQNNFVEVEVIAEDNTSRTLFRCNKCLQRFQSRRILGSHMLKCGEKNENDEEHKEIEIVEKVRKKKKNKVGRPKTKQNDYSVVKKLKPVIVNGNIDGVPTRLFYCRRCRKNYKTRKSFRRHIGATCERSRIKAQQLKSVEMSEDKNYQKPQIKKETKVSIEPKINQLNESLNKNQPKLNKSGSNNRFCKNCRIQFSSKYTLARHIRNLGCSRKRKQLSGGSTSRKQK